MYNNHPFNRSIYATLIQISSLSQNMCWLTKIKVDSSLHSKRQSICEHLKYNVLIFNKACVCVHTPIQRVLGALSLGVKRLWREADHSLPSRAEVKSAWSYTSTPKSVFMAWCLVKHTDFTFTFTKSIYIFDLTFENWMFTYITKLMFEKMSWNVDWNELVQKTVKWRVLFNTSINTWLP
jgi:hypothetical protein